MLNWNLKLNLAGLKHSVKKLKGQSGEVECLIIPIDANHLYRGEKGMYLDLTAIESKNAPKEGFKDTHFIKQSLPKEVYEKLTEAERKATPIMGNMAPWDGSANTPEVNDQEEGDALPF